MRASTLSIPRRVREASALLGLGLGFGLGSGPRVRANIVDAEVRVRVTEHEVGLSAEGAPELVEVFEVVAEQVAPGARVTAAVHAAQPHGDGRVRVRLLRARFRVRVRV